MTDRCWGRHRNGSCSQRILALAATVQLGRAVALANAWRIELFVPQVLEAPSDHDAGLNWRRIRLSWQAAARCTSLVEGQIRRDMPGRV